MSSNDCGGRRGCRIATELDLSVRGLRTTLGPLQEQQVLLTTELSLFIFSINLFVSSYLQLGFLCVLYNGLFYFFECEVSLFCDFFKI